MFPTHWYELLIDRPLLNPTYVLESTSLQLSCRIAGLHIDKFEWYQNGKLIAVCSETAPSSLVTTEIDRGGFHASYDTLPAHFIALLTVDETEKDRHEGNYECHASNAHYQVSSSCQVIVREACRSTVNLERISPFKVNSRPILIIFCFLISSSVLLVSFTLTKSRSEKTSRRDTRKCFRFY